MEKIVERSGHIVHNGVVIPATFRSIKRSNNPSFFVPGVDSTPIERNQKTEKKVEYWELLAFMALRSTTDLDPVDALKHVRSEEFMKILQEENVTTIGALKDFISAE